ncbi:MAG: hypothetical protein HZA90_16670 [Verrucomicrobia bacterium]|nr:hypothetical protein [Verrucomicrobiota bacterium]
MPDPAPNPDLLRSLGQLVRGLSVLFWGIPAALVICVQTAQADYLKMLGVFPPLIATAVPLHGLLLLARFRREERIWIEALERARVFAIVNLGLSPFLFWWSKMPANPFFTLATELLAVSGMLFLLTLNPALRRLTAMLPDEALRHETGVFTKMNTGLILLNLALLLGSFALAHLKTSPFVLGRWQFLLDRLTQWGVWFLVLLTTATTMALIWKTKEVIFHSVFGGEHGT